MNDPIHDQLGFRIAQVSWYAESGEAPSAAIMREWADVMRQALVRTDAAPLPFYDPTTSVAVGGAEDATVFVHVYRKAGSPADQMLTVLDATGRALGTFCEATPVASYLAAAVVATPPGTSGV